MIALFRKIRKDLMKQNKVTRYLAYSIGEVLLVLVGILIALEINNANERGKAREFEVKMLIEVKKALGQDLNFFENHLIGHRNQTELDALAFFENYLITDKIDQDSIDYYFDRLTFGLQVTYNRGPYDALKSTGLDRVSNDSLRNRMVYVYDFIYPRYEGLIMSGQDYASEAMYEIKSKLRQATNYRVENNKVYYSGVKLKPIDIKTNKAFIELLEQAKSKSSWADEELKTLTPYMEELINLIAAEVNH